MSITLKERENAVIVTTEAHWTKTPLNRERVKTKNSSLSFMHPKKPGFG